MNDILKYTSKDYKSILEDLKSSIPSLTDLWTNMNDGDPGIVLVKLMSALGDMLSYNMDKQALEYYSSTVTQRKNAAKLFNLIGYKMKWYQSATNTITLTNIVPKPGEVALYKAYTDWQATTEGTEEWYDKRDIYLNTKSEFEKTHNYLYYPQYYDINESTHTATIKADEQLIPIVEVVVNDWTSDLNNNIQLYIGITNPNANLKLFTNNLDSIPYMIIPKIENNMDNTGAVINYDYSLEPGQSIDLDVVQGTLQIAVFNGDQLRNNRFYFNESTIDENHMWLKWEGMTNNTLNQSGFIGMVDNLLTVTDGDIHFEFNVDEFDHPYIELSNYWTSKLPQGTTIKFSLYYIRTLGMYGNITANYLKYIEGIPTNKYTITHPSNTSPYYSTVDDKVLALPGYNPETPHQAYINSLNWVTTFDSLVTIYDFERFCKRQPGITNAFAVDKQRSIDLNNELQKVTDSLGHEQLLAYARMSSEYRGTDDDITLRRLYYDHKKVLCDDWEPEKDYENYSLQLHLIWDYFRLREIEPDGTEIPMADMMLHITNEQSTVGKNQYLLYRLRDPNNDTDNSRPDSNVVSYIDKAITETGVVTVQRNYAAVRLFPWYCCGVLHLKTPVTKSMAETILRTVMQHLAQAFGPQNLEFGKTIKYMDVINVVSKAHEYIRYFDAGLGDKKLIYIDDNIDFSYFNATSLMYYVQDYDTYNIRLTNGTYPVYGNNDLYTAGGYNNKYYHLLSIAPEYILED